MLGLMQDWPLLCHRVIDHAAIFHGERKVITRSVEGPMHTTNYAEIRARALKVAQRLDKDGIKLGDRVATLAWNTWRHLEVLVRHPRHRRGLSHREPAPLPRTDCLDHQPRRRPGDDGRSHFRAAAGKNRRQAADHRTLHRAHRRGAHAEDHLEKCGGLRRLDRRGGRRFRLEIVRRKHGRGHVLHVRHDRTPQGRGLLAPLQCPARLHGGDAGLQGPVIARCRAAGGADVPRQWLVACLFDADGRRDGDYAGRQSSTALRSTSCSIHTKCHSPRRCRQCG